MPKGKGASPRTPSDRGNRGNELDDDGIDFPARCLPYVLAYGNGVQRRFKRDIKEDKEDRLILSGDFRGKLELDLDALMRDVPVPVSGVLDLGHLIFTTIDDVLSASASVHDRSRLTLGGEHETLASPFPASHESAIRQAFNDRVALSPWMSDSDREVQFAEIRNKMDLAERSRGTLTSCSGLVRLLESRIAAVELAVFTGQPGAPVFDCKVDLRNPTSFTVGLVAPRKVARSLKLYGGQIEIRPASASFEDDKDRADGRVFDASFDEDEDGWCKSDAADSQEWTAGSIGVGTYTFKVNQQSLDDLAEDSGRKIKITPDTLYEVRARYIFKDSTARGLRTVVSEPATCTVRTKPDRRVRKHRPQNKRGVKAVMGKSSKRPRKAVATTADAIADATADALVPTRSQLPSAGLITKIYDPCELAIGDVLWAKMKYQPWWPCVVAENEESGEFYNRANKKVHVVFFGEPSHAGIKLQNLHRFECNIPGVTDCKVHANQERKWLAAIEKAKTFLGIASPRNVSADQADQTAPQSPSQHSEQRAMDSQEATLLDSKLQVALDIGSIGLTHHYQRSQSPEQPQLLRGNQSGSSPTAAVSAAAAAQPQPPVASSAATAQPTCDPQLIDQARLQDALQVMDGPHSMSAYSKYFPALLDAGICDITSLLDAVDDAAVEKTGTKWMDDIPPLRGKPIPQKLFAKKIHEYKLDLVQQRQTDQMPEQQNEIQVCCFTQRPFRVKVRAADGHHYEESRIRKWFERYESMPWKSPYTRQVYMDRALHKCP
eukprot:COSAG01_NODE_406_length_17453_cov_83.218105_4_plen_776_part_00